MEYANKFRSLIRDNVFLTFKDVVYVAILTALLIFISFIIHVRSEPGTFEDFVVIYFGFPLEWFKISAPFHSWYASVASYEIIWTGLALDVIMFVLLSIFLVRVAETVAEHVLKRPS